MAGPLAAWVSDTLCDWIMPMKSTLILDSLFLPRAACRRKCDGKVWQRAE
jgi:hypothetical protein